MKCAIELLILSISLTVSAAGINIPATANIFGAGGGALADGSAPPVVSFGAGTISKINFTAVTGLVTCGIGFCAPTPPDGFNSGYTGTNIVSSNAGISGIQFAGRQMFLIGVFLTNSAPSGTVTNFQAYTGASALAASFSPAVGQLFFVGDGTGSAGILQDFVVPSNATRLFLGFADGSPQFGSTSIASTPNAYADNTGSFDATVDLVHTPEPATGLLLALGFAGLAFARARHV